MKKLVFLLLSVFFCLKAFSQSAISQSSYVYCSPYYGNYVPEFYVKKVKGSYYFSVPRLPGKWFPAKARVQVVDTLADLRVNETYNLRDNNVLVFPCDSVPQEDLHWQFVKSDPDFTIQFVYKDFDMVLAFWANSEVRPKALRLQTPTSTYWTDQ